MMKHTMMSINQRECDLMRSFEHFPMDFIVNLLDLNAFSDEFLMKQKRDMNREYKYYKCKEIASDFGQFTLVNVVQEEVMTFRTISTTNYIEIVLNLLKLLWFGATNDGMMRSFEHFPLDFICFCLLCFKYCICCCFVAYICQLWYACVLG
eukprot:973430_1